MLSFMIRNKERDKGGFFMLKLNEHGLVELNLDEYGNAVLTQEAMDFLQNQMNRKQLPAIQVETGSDYFIQMFLLPSEVDGFKELQVSLFKKKGFQFPFRYISKNITYLPKYNIFNALNGNHSLRTENGELILMTLKMES